MLCGLFEIFSSSLFFSGQIFVEKLARLVTSSSYFTQLKVSESILRKGPAILLANRTAEMFILYLMFSNQRYQLISKSILSEPVGILLFNYSLRT